MTNNLPRNDINQINSYLNYITDLNYKERPVDIKTFLKEDYFIGKSTNNLKAIYPGWIDPIQEIFRNNSQYLVVLTGSIGIGKSTIAVYCMAYILYRVLCLKDPHKYFNLAGQDSFAVSFFNLTRTLGDSRGFQKLQNVLMSSEWFTTHGGKIRGKEDKYVDIPLFTWKISSPMSKGFGIVGEDIVLGVMDEVDDPSASMGQKNRVLKAYEASVRRFESRFVYDQESISRFFLVSSKQDEMSFLETYIESMKGSDRVLIIDKAQWEIKPKAFYSGVKFPVLVGDAYNESKVLSDDERIDAIKSGKTVVDVPIELKFDFERDTVAALRDFAGIAVRGLRRYKLFPADQFIYACYDKEKESAFKTETIEIGLKDTVEIISLFDFSKIRVGLHEKRYIHMDISFSGDCLGLACSCVSGWIEKNIENADGSFTSDAVPVIETDFCIRFRARDGDRIPLYKIRKFILDLRSRGFIIGGFSADLLLASEDTTQILTKADIPCEYFSLDKNTNVYLSFRDVVFERRWICHYSQILSFELKALEHDRDKNKIDHPENVKDIEILPNGDVKHIVAKGSKDVSDAVVGSVMQAIKNAIKPIDIKKALEAFAKTRRSFGVNAMPSDWFIDTKDKDAETGVLVHDSEQISSILDSLQRYKKNRPR